MDRVDSRRARELASLAAGLAGGSGAALPDRLALWALAGGRPDAVAAERCSDPAAALGSALEARLGARERRRGAHYTPRELSERLVATALLEPATAGPVCDPACGGGAMLLAAARRLAAAGHRPADVARHHLWGADTDPLAAAVTEAAIALWSGGTPPASGHVVAADPLLDGSDAWARVPPGGFGAVVGNPPFQGQLLAGTARARSEAARLRERFGAAAARPYVDTAALFLLRAVDLAADGARVALVQPRSTVAARDAGGVRAELAGRALVVDLWVVPTGTFDASVEACVLVLAVGQRGDPEWGAILADGEGVPAVALEPARPVGSVAHAVGGFREEYYGLVPHVREAADHPGGAPLITTGLIDVGTAAWGRRPARFARRRWSRPVVDLGALQGAAGRAWRHARRLQRPKVLVSPQGRVVEAVADAGGGWVPSTPVVSVLPDDPSLAGPLSAALCSPPVSAWSARRAAGTGRARGAFRLGARQVAAVPLPRGGSAWAEGAAAFAAWAAGEDGSLRWAEQLTAAYGVRGATADELLEWWAARLPRPR